MKRISRFVCLICIAAIAMSFYSLSAFAYNGEMAKQYAITYGTSRNKVFKSMDQDCTNFVSQCAKMGGIPQKIHYGHGLKPNGLRDWVNDPNGNYWYHIQETQQIGIIKRKIYVYSNTWAFVDNFRSYMGRHATIKTLAKSESDINSKTKIGDVIQVAGTHSCIITAKGYYSQHSTDRINAPMRDFVDFAKTKNKAVYGICF